MRWWNMHGHSRYSSTDGLYTPQQRVERAVELGYPALGLTDHGNMGGAAEHYMACRRAGIKPLPGVEAYIAIDRGVQRPRTMHMLMLSTSAKGYTNLVGVVNNSYRNFKYKPVIDLADLASYHEDGMLEGIYATTGCWFGIGATLLREAPARGAEQVVRALAGWFDGMFAVELQKHGIMGPDQDEEGHVALMHGMALHIGLPIVITDDSHYITDDSRMLHDAMKRMTSWSDDPDSAVFPGDVPYAMRSHEDMEAMFDPDVFKDSLVELDRIADMSDVRIPEYDDYVLKVPGGYEDPDLTLQRAVSRSMSGIIGTQVSDESSDVYIDRVYDELEVVEESGFASYLLFVADVCAKLRELGIDYRIRGSASGSLLCMLLGISSIDPIRWGLMFDRFLSRDRAKPPDIDIDVRHDRRGEIMEWLRENYSTVQIGTWLQGGIADSDDEQKGSLVVRYRQMQRKMGAGASAAIPEADWALLRELSAAKPYLGNGVHAAGVLVAPDDRAIANLPINYVASSKTYTTAFPMSVVEQGGYVKLDVLGLKTLTGMAEAERISGSPAADAPLDDAGVMRMLVEDGTDGVFQLEGHSSRSGVARLIPRSVEDIIAAMALFRPATMESGATESYIRRRSGRAKVPKRHPIIMGMTADTYGILLYQEQALAVFKALGMTVEEIEKARKAIKASNAGTADAGAVLDSLMDRMKNLAHGAGMSNSDVKWLEETLKAFAGYSFNRAHATSYGLLAYQTAWMRLHHPVAFWTGMLNAYIGADQEAAYLKAAKRDGVGISKAHVNKSGALYTADVSEGTILKGLTSIQGIGQVAASEIAAHAPYASLEDFAMRVSHRRVTGSKSLGMGNSPYTASGSVTALALAGAFEGME